MKPTPSAAPAFPLVVEFVGPTNDPIKGVQVPAGHAERHIFTGISVRDYFIAHAPAEPQPWFSPVLPPKEEPLKPFVEMHTDVTDEERRALNSFNSDWMTHKDVKEVRVQAYLLEREEQVKRQREYRVMSERELYLQWPAAWADAMLKARAS